MTKQWRTFWEMGETIEKHYGEISEITKVETPLVAAREHIRSELNRYRLSTDFHETFP